MIAAILAAAAASASGDSAVPLASRVERAEQLKGDRGALVVSMRTRGPQLDTLTLWLEPVDAAARAGVRPIITRSERVAVNIADGFARATNGERILPCVTQYGPGAEAALERCIASVAAGRAALCEVATHEENAMALSWR